MVEAATQRGSGIDPTTVQATAAKGSTYDPLKVQVNLFVSGHKLMEENRLSKSDPLCVLFEKRQDQWLKIGQTEQINNSLNPDFKTAIQITYSFEKKQLLKFLFIDGDGSGDYDTIGSMEVTLGIILGGDQQAHYGELVFRGT